ncbi:MAG: hypothetical protein SNG02_03585 [Rikenellaceae bacterium]
MIRKIIISLAVATISMAQAQNLNSYKRDLTSPSSATEATVVINESPEAQSALSQISRQTDKNGFLGYRIGIFFDNSPTARAKADAAKELFVENFPDEAVYMIYENPYFKVSAGNCVTQEEAVILLDKIQKVFPKAYLMREQMLVKDIILQEKISADSLSM